MSQNTTAGGPVDYSAILGQLRARAEAAEAELAETRQRLAAVEALVTIWEQRDHGPHAGGNDGEDCVRCMAGDIRDHLGEPSD